jgi:hypothetical protein
LNDGLPSLRDVVRHLAAHTTAEPIVLYPGDTWTVGDRHDNDAAIDRYEADAANPMDLTVPRRSFSLDELCALSVEHAWRLRRRSNQMLAVRVLERARFLPPVRIRLWDIDTTVEFRCDRGLRETMQVANIEMSTDSLAFCLEHDFGAETLYVNGRYRIVRGPEKLFFRHFYPAILNNQGYSFPVGAAQLVFSDRIAWRARAAAEALRRSRDRIGITPGAADAREPASRRA